MKKNHLCIGGPIDGQVIEVDKKHHFYICPHYGTTNTYFPKHAIYQILSVTLNGKKQGVFVSTDLSETEIEYRVLHNLRKIGETI